jgi:hypothetical protein
VARLLKNCCLLRTQKEQGRRRLGPNRRQSSSFSQQDHVPHHGDPEHSGIWVDL